VYRQVEAVPPPIILAGMADEQSKRERQRQNRAEKARQQRREAQIAAVRRRVLQLVVVAVVVAGVIALAWLSQRSQDELEFSNTYEELRSFPTACGAAAPDPLEPAQYTSPEDQNLSEGSTLTAVVATSCGDITIELEPASAPENVNSFVFLAREGFYDGTIMHRLVSEFVIQGGDPEATGLGGPGYTVTDEFPDSDFVYEPGTVAVARSALANSGGSQFFIVTGEQGEVLAPQFSVLGRVTDGFDVIDLIAQIEVGGPSNEGSTPQETVYIESVTITD